MNNGDSNEPLETWIDPNLEVRILSMILGEASEFEQAELQKEILEKRICQNELKGCNTFTTAIFLNQNTMIIQTL